MKYGLHNITQYLQEQCHKDRLESCLFLRSSTILIKTKWKFQHIAGYKAKLGTIDQNSIKDTLSSLCCHIALIATLLVQSTIVAV